MKTVLVVAAAAVNCALAVTLRGTGGNAHKLVAWGTGSDSDQLEADGTLRPEVVAQLLGQVGMMWVHDRYEAMEHSISDALALAHITESCSKVASAVVMGAKGDRHKVKEYMGFVCEKSHHKPLCQNFTSDIYGFMNGDLMYNRQELNYTRFCERLYNTTLVGAAQDEKVRLEKAWEEHLKEDEAKQKRAEEEKLAEEKRLAEEKKAQAEAEAKAEADKAEQEKLAAQAKEEEAAKAAAEEKAAIEEADKLAANSPVKEVATVPFNSTKNATNATDVLAKAEVVIAAAKTTNATAAANATAANVTNATAVANATNATKVA